MKGQENTGWKKCSYMTFKARVQVASQNTKTYFIHCINEAGVILSVEVVTTIREVNSQGIGVGEETKVQQRHHRGGIACNESVVENRGSGRMHVRILNLLVSNQQSLLPKIFLLGLKCLSKCQL